MKTYEEFNKKIGLFLEKKLAAYSPENRGKKVIHDPLWGSNFFYPWEIAILDTPLFQRLRRIHQTGTAFFTYPSSSHNRFTHSLGVVILANRLLNKLKQEFDIPYKDIFEVRIAGLLHDVGHCFFSHTSEQIFKMIEDFHEISREFPPFQNKNPHEIFAYLIVTHDIFKAFW